MSTDRLSIRLPVQSQEELAAIVRATGKTESEVVRDALAAYCQAHLTGPTCYDVAKKAGFLGCVKGGPDDLSVNPRYMEGFGRE